MKKILVFLGGLLSSCLLIYSVSYIVYSEGIIKVNCFCKCAGREISETGAADQGITELGGVTKDADKQCAKQCAMTCGRSSSLSGGDEECVEKCEEFCNNKESGYDGGSELGSFTEDCVQGCVAPCTFRGFVNGLIDLLYTVAGVLGAVLLIIAGVRLLSSSEPGGRVSAKKSMLYIISALILIAVAGFVVKIITGASSGFGLAGPYSEPANNCVRCGSGAAVCTREWCHSLYGCFYASAGTCLPCSQIKHCTDYPSDVSCSDNNCGVDKDQGGCVWDKVKGCMPANPSADNPRCFDCANTGLFGGCTKEKCEAIKGCWWGMVTDIQGQCNFCDPKYSTSYTVLDKGCAGYNYGTACRENVCGVPGGCVWDNVKKKCVSKS